MEKDVFTIHGPSGCPEHYQQIDVKGKLSYCPVVGCEWIRVVDRGWVDGAETPQQFQERINAMSSEVSAGV